MFVSDLSDLEDLREKLIDEHRTLVYRQARYNHMLILCSQCGLIQVMPDSENYRDESFSLALEFAREHYTRENPNARLSRPKDPATCRGQRP